MRIVVSSLGPTLKKFINLVYTPDLVVLGSFLKFQVRTDNFLNSSDWKGRPLRN